MTTLENNANETAGTWRKVALGAYLRMRNIGGFGRWNQWFSLTLNWCSYTCYSSYLSYCCTPLLPIHLTPTPAILHVHAGRPLDLVYVSLLLLIIFIYFGIPVYCCNLCQQHPPKIIASRFTWEPDHGRLAWFCDRPSLPCQQGPQEGMNLTKFAIISVSPGGENVEGYAHHMDNLTIICGSAVQGNKNAATMKFI